MTALVFTGWREGFLKVSFTKLIQTETSYSLREAKDVTDSILEGNSVQINIDHVRNPEYLVKEAWRLGAECSILRLE